MEMDIIIITLSIILVIGIIHLKIDISNLKKENKELSSIVGKALDNTIVYQRKNGKLYDIEVNKAVQLILHQFHLRIEWEEGQRGYWSIVDKLIK